MKILSIDTVSNICGISILEDHNLIKKFDITTNKTHSENLLPMIEKSLQEIKLSLKNINLIVVDKGPGSFTGIRIGISTIKAFKDSLNIPCVGVSSLKALCYNVKNTINPNYTGYVCSLVDCKNDNCFYAVYEFKNGDSINIIEPSVDNINYIIDLLLKYNDIILVGDGVTIYSNLIKNNLNNYSLIDNNQLNSYSLGLAGIDEFSKYGDQNILPLYLKKPPVKEIKNKK